MEFLDQVVDPVLGEPGTATISAKRAVRSTLRRKGRLTKFLEALPHNRRQRAARAPQRYGSMRDWVADWHKWSRAERVLAVLVGLLLAALPLSLLIGAKGGV